MKKFQCGLCDGRVCTLTTSKGLSPGWSVEWCPLASTGEVGALPSEWIEAKPRGG